MKESRVENNRSSYKWNSTGAYQTDDKKVQSISIDVMPIILAIILIVVFVLCSGLIKF